MLRNLRVTVSIVMVLFLTTLQDKNLGKRRLNSGILGTSVANLSITGLQDSVVIRLRNTELIPVN